VVSGLEKQGTTTTTSKRKESLDSDFVAFSFLFSYYLLFVDFCFV